MYKIILASGSPRRTELLKLTGADFEVRVSNALEITDKTEPAEMVEELAVLKATAVEKELAAEMEKEKAEKEVEKLLIISADTLVFLEGKPLGKPKDKEDAYCMLSKLSGKVHEVYTGVSVIIKESNERKQLIFHQKTNVAVAAMTGEEINSYIATGEPFDKAGAYGIQGRFAVYVKGIEGEYNNIVGLPIAKIYRELAKEGIDILK